MRCIVTTALILALHQFGAHAQVITLAEPGFVLPYGESIEKTFTPTGDYQSVRLNFSVRLDAPDAAGSTHVMRLAVNGQGVTGGLTRTQARLLNKPLTARMASGLEVPWVRGSVWRVVYSPDFQLAGDEAAGGSRILDASPYRFVLDITDLVQRDVPNTLTIQHQGGSLDLRRYFKETNPSLDFVFEELTVELSRQPSVARRDRSEEQFHADRIMWRPPAACDAQEAIVLDDRGGLMVKLPGLSLHVLSRFSWQGGGFNSFGDDPDAKAQEGWSVRVSGEGDERRVIGAAPEYRVERAITWQVDHVRIADTFTNLTDANLGLAFDNALRGDPAQVVDAWVGGNPDPAATVVRYMENSTVFVAGESSGCGLVALDDVYRVQGIVYYDNRGGIRSDTFCLPPGGSYTVRWALYPIGRADYYDFINLVRRDLDVNFTVPGGFEFGLSGINAMSDEALRSTIADKGLRFIASGVWFDREGDVPCYHGSHMLEATRLQEQLRDAAAKLRRVEPDVKSLIYIHTSIDTNPEGPERYADSRIITEGGAHYENTGYTKRIGIPFFYYYIAEGNSYLEAMKRVVDMCLDADKIGADGIYWDEVEMISPKRTYDRWDGYSAELDEQHRIKRVFGDPQLLSMEAKMELVQYIASKGGVLIGNSCPVSETMTALQFPRFVETAAEWYPARAHLFTPIALGDHLTVKTFDDLLADIRLKLMWGSLYYYYARPAQPHLTITQRMFPFTPVELHKGWLLGKERIITAVPGTFTFGDEGPVTVYWYGPDGALSERQGEERVDEGRRLVRLDLAEKEMAVIERAADQ